MIYSIIIHNFASEIIKFDNYTLITYKKEWIE